MKKSLLIFLFILSFSIINAQWTQIGPTLIGDMPEDTFGETVSMNAAGDIIALGTPINDTAGVNYGQVKVFRFENNNWIQMGSSLYGNVSSQAGEKFGFAIDLSDSGLRLVVGSPWFNDGIEIPGAIQVFDYNGSDWVQLGSTIEGENNNDLFGWDVAISNDGSRIIGGGGLNSDNGLGSGQAIVYEYNGSNWIQLGNDIEGQSEYLFAGDAVDISGNGNYVAVGYPNNGPPSGPQRIGEVRIFELENGIWEQIGGTIFEEFIQDDFGRVISLNDSGNRIALGARLYSGNESFSGHIGVFELQSGSWVQLGSDMEGVAFEALGTAVSLNAAGNILIAGGRANNPNDLEKGVSRIFRFTNGDWEQYDEPIYGVAAGDRSGYAVGINNTGDTVVVGAYQNDDNGNNSGHARTFFNEDILAISSNELVVNTNLYPNPNNGSFTLNFSETHQNINVSILDITGKIFSSETFLNSENIVFNHNLSAGIYFVNVKTEDSEATLKMIID